MENIEQKVLEQIEQEHIKPLSPWLFWVKDYGIWVIFAVSTIFGGLAVAIILDSVASQDFEFLRKTGGSILELLVLSVPYIWVAAMAGFFLFSGYALRHTRNGYRISLIRLGLFHIIFSILIGVISFSLGLGQAIDRFMIRNLPYYEHAPKLRGQGYWERPERGFIFGSVRDIKTQQSFILQDPRGDRWQVLCEMCEDLNPDIRIQDVLRVMGERRPEMHFEAHMVRFAAPMVPR
ncbi:MAG: hypothetical protein WC045_01300 [Patescibacteria group bacterium]